MKKRMEKGSLMAQILSILPTSAEAAITVDEIISAIGERFAGLYEPSEDAIRDNLKRIEEL